MLIFFNKRVYLFWNLSCFKLELRFLAFTNPNPTNSKLENEENTKPESEDNVSRENKDFFLSMTQNFVSSYCHVIAVFVGASHMLNPLLIATN